MTAGCVGGGPSHAKPGTELIVRYSAGLLAAIFAAYDLTWLIPVIPLVGLADIPLTSFCAADPPTLTALTAAESTALLNLSFGADFDSGLGKVKDLILNTIWHDACECVSGATTPLTPPTPPVGTGITQFPNAGNLPCGGGGRDQNLAEQWGNGGTFGRFIADLTPSSKECVVTLNSTISTGGGWDPLITLNFRKDSGGGAHIGPDYNFTVARTGVTVCRVPVPAGAGVLHMLWIGPGGTAAIDLVNYQVELLCAPGTGPLQGCCPPDPATQSYLDNILQLVTLIQRQIVPFAHVLGTVHAGLTGQGTIGVSGLLGVKLDLTTIPASYGVEIGSPDYHFDLGWLSVLTPDGFIDQRRISAQLTSWLPRLMSDATVIGYSLNPGVVGTITEILREP